jgi:hypothetical protein
MLKNVREYRRDNQKRIIQRNWQHRVHKAKKNKQKHNTICVGHHYTQTNTQIVNKICAGLLQTTGGKELANSHTNLKNIIITKGKQILHHMKLCRTPVCENKYE